MLPWFVTLCPPLLLFVFVLEGYVQVAILRQDLDEQGREWWSNLSGWILMVAFGWLAVFGVVIFGTWLFIPEWQSHGGLKIAAGAGWAVSVLSGLATGAGPNTSGKATTGRWQDQALEWIAFFTPVVFLVGYAIAISELATWSCFHELEIPLTHDRYWGAFSRRHSLGLSLDTVSVAIFSCAILGATGGFLILVVFKLLGKVVDVNLFSLQELYKNRLVRCYLGGFATPRQGLQLPGRGRSQQQLFAGSPA